MPSYLEVWQSDGVRVVVLDAAQATVGSAPSNSVVIAADRSV